VQASPSNHRPPLFDLLCATRGHVNMRWKDLVELFKLIYGSLIYDSIWSLKSSSKVWVSSCFVLPGCQLAQVGRWSYFEGFVCEILESVEVVWACVGKSSWSSSNWYMLRSFMIPFGSSNLTPNFGFHHVSRCLAINWRKLVVGPTLRHSFAKSLKI